MNARLVATSGLEGRAECILEPGKSYTIGRSHGVDFLVAHPSVSRAHCKLIFAPPGKWVVTDLGSSNGVFIGRRRVSTEILSDGDAIRLGKVVLEFSLRPPSDAASPPAASAPAEPPPLPEMAAETVPLPAPAAAREPTTVSVAAPPRASARKAALALMAALALLACLAGILLLRRPKGEPTKPAETPLVQPLTAKGTRKVARIPRKGRLVKAFKLDDAKGFTPLHTAARQGQRADVDALLAKGADVNAWDTPDPADKSGRRLQPLHVAIIEDRAEIALLLLNKGANPNGDLGFGTPLHVAAATNNVPLALLLLDRGAAVGARDARRQTPLHLAAANGCEEAAELLVDIEAPINSWSSDGLTPLHLAAAGGHVAVAKVLLEAGADPDLANSYGHRTPLHEAAARGKRAVAELLIARGANVNARTSTVVGGGATPLHDAARGGHRGLVVLLLARGADPRAANDAGRTPRDEALAASHQDLAELLTHPSATTRP